MRNPSLANHQCESCGYPLVFSPKTGSLACASCRTEYAVVREAVAPKRPITEKPLSGQNADNLGSSAGITRNKCKACGAVSSSADGATLSDSCSYCTATNQNHAVHGLYWQPDNLVAFRKPQTEAVAQVKEWVSTRWFAPSKLRHAYELKELLRGCYLPYWNFDANADTQYHGQRGTYYYDTKTRTVWTNGIPKQESYQERRTEWTPVSGSVFNSFVDVLIPAQSVVNQGILDIDESDIEKEVKFSEVYLLGFQALNSDVPIVEGLATAREQMEESIDSAIRRDIGGDEQRVSSTNIAWSDEKYSMVMLPFWVGAYRFNGKPYKICVNGSTGEVDGERPYSYVKIGAAALAVGLAFTAGAWHVEIAEYAGPVLEQIQRWVAAF